MARRKVAVVQPLCVPGGGTEAVTAWTIEALKSEWSVTLISFSTVDADALNNFYETELRENEFSTVRPNLPPLLGRTGRLAMLKDHLMMRYCKSVRTDYDLFIGVGGGMDFGRKGIQYGAYTPASTLIKILSHQPGIPKWYYLSKRYFMRICESISGFSEDSLRSNVTLATSGWIGKRMEEMYSIHDYQVVYPPVNSPARNTPWEMRQEGFLCIARIVPEKLVDQAVEILKRVRQRGFDVSLHIIGRPDDPHYFAKIKELCDENSPWVFLHSVLPKNELFHLIDQNKYGINAASGEPAGISALEMVKSGCIVFVRDGGGLPEIVDTPELTYQDLDDAVEKIASVLSNEGLQKSLRSRLEEQAKTFSTEAYCRTIQRVVQEFFAAV